MHVGPGTMKERCSYEDIAPLMTNAVLLQTVVITAVAVCAFMFSKTTLDQFRKKYARATVVVIGAGPIGLTSVLIASRSGKAARIILYDEKGRYDLMNKPHQIALEPRSVNFMKHLGVDFDNIEGCWHHRSFFTRIGVFQEYLLDVIYRLETTVEVKLNSKFTKETLKELDAIPGRMIVIVCDGLHGHSASLLGVSDEFTHHSCRSYGAVSAIERHDECQVPTREIRVHNLTFDLNAYGNDCGDDPYPMGFHLKIFGSVRHRYISIAVPKCESKLVKSLKVVLDQSIMRNIFQACFNAYKLESERDISDHLALKMRFSPRLFEIKLSQRMENVAYIEDVNLFVLTEGDAARYVNFHSGMDVNLGIRGLTTLETFIKMAATAETEKSIQQALMYKFNHAHMVAQEFIKSGMRECMYTG